MFDAPSEEFHSVEQDNPFDNLEERLLSEEKSSPVKTKKIKISKIVKHVLKIMKPFDNNKQAKKILSRKQLSVYLEQIKNQEENEGSSGRHQINCSNYYKFRGKSTRNLQISC